MSTDSNIINYVEFPAADADQVQKAVSFYNAVFGWDYQMWGDSYADTPSSGIGSGISGGGEGTSRGILPVIQSEDLDASYKAVVANGGTITQEIFSFPGGKRFHFRDVIGNELAIWIQVEE